jgi:hypothetical protein
LGYIRRLAAQIEGLNLRHLDTVAEDIFNKPLAQLTAREGSELIHFLQNARHGEARLEPLRNGEAS